MTQPLDTIEPPSPTGATAPTGADVPRNPITGFLTGASYPLRTLGVLARTPQLWQYVLVPLLINIALGIGLYAWLLPGGLRRIDAALAGIPPWLAFLDPILSFIFGLILLLLLGIVLLWFGSLLGLPWYLRLSRKVEAWRGCRASDEPFTLATALLDLRHSLMYEVKKLLLLIVAGIALLLFNLVPGLGALAASFGGLLLMGMIACLDFFDPVLSRNRLRFRDKLGLFWKLMPVSGGFAFVSAFMVIIPLLNLFSIPLGIASGTLLLCDYRWQQLLPKHKHATGVV